MKNGAVLRQDDPLSGPGRRFKSAAADLRAKLARTGHPLTRSRRALLEIIAVQRGTFKAADLVGRLPPAAPAAGRATIFRTLELLTALGAIERLDLPGGEHAYIRCEPGHHHHVVCTSCGRSQDLDLSDCGMAEIVTEAARRSGFTIDRHRIEFFGRCANCSGSRS